MTIRIVVNLEIVRVDTPKPRTPAAPAVRTKHRYKAESNPFQLPLFTVPDNIIRFPDRPAA